jgi:hypothetical protein
VTASLVAWELERGAMELGAEDIMIRIGDCSCESIVRGVEELGKYTHEDEQNGPCLLTLNHQYDMRVDCVCFVNDRS